MIRSLRPVFGSLTLAIFLVPAASEAIVSELSVLIDTDHDAATGCTVPTPEGPFDGVEERLEITVETFGGGTGQVQGVTRSSCVNPATDTFGAPVVVDPGGWPVGIGLGIDGSHVVEAYTSLAAIGAGQTIRFGIVHESGAEGDALLETSPLSGADIVLLTVSLLEIPTLSEWGALLLILLLAAIAFRTMRRRETIAFFLLVGAVGTGGAVWAACVMDGMIDDWAGVAPLAQDATAEASSAVDLVAFFAKVETDGTLCLRIDTFLAFDEPPVAVDDAATVAEDAPATPIDVLANDTDSDGGPISIQSVTQPTNGTVVVTNAGADLTYQPDPDYCNAPPGTTLDTFTYTLTPGGDTATVSVTVTCVDDAPVAVDDAATVAEDASATAIDVLANDTDLESDLFTIASVTQPANGTVVITGGGTGLTYQPDADYCNSPPGTTPDTFTYTLAPGGDTATVSVTVTCQDDPPVAVDDAATVAEDSGANAIDVLANDTDVDAGAKSVQSVTQPANGTVAITGGGTGVSYTPDANYCNDPPGTTTDDFTYTLNGGSSATVSVTVTCSDDPPVAVDDTTTVGEDSGANPIDVLLNDTDSDGGPIQVTVVQNPSANGGTVTITGGGSGVAYAPAANYCNSPPGTTPDTFTYTLNGGSSATVSVTVTCVNDAPVLDLDADDDKGTGGADFAVAYTEGDGAVLLEDPDDPTGATITDIDSTTLVSLTVTLTNLLDAGEELLDADVSAFSPDIVKDYDTTTPGVGVLTISSVTPQPIADYVAVLRTVAYEHTGADPDATARVVQFVANDGTSDSNTAISTVSITAVDDDPVAVDDTATVAEDDPATTIDVLANDTDADGGPISIQSVTQPTNGTVVITNAGADLTYEPDPDYCNDGTPTDDFTYTLNGGDTGSVAVTVTCVDDAPIAVNDAATVAEDSGATAVVVLTNDTDADGGLKEIQSVTQPTNGTVVITGGGTGLTYQPDANYCNDGSPLDTFTYTLNGGSIGTVSMTVTCVDDDPVAVVDAATVVEDSGANAIDVLANDTDVDGGPISVTSVTQPTNGSVAITGGGTGVSYTPDANYCNDGTPTDDFTYTLNGGSSTTVAVTVTCVDDPPTAVADAATVNEDSGANAIDVLANDTDVDGGPKTVQSKTDGANGTVAITGGGTGVTYTPNLNYCNNGSPTDSFTYTLNGGSSTTVSVTVICINDPPVAGNDSFDFVGNTELRVDLAAAATPHALEATGSGFGLLDNDSDPVENDPISIVSVTGCADATAPFDCTIAGVGTVHIESNGRFSFVPLPGDTDASEVFTYTLSDGTDTVNATVTLNRSERVWYVKNDTGTAGTAGTSVDPFDTLVEAQTASLANDYIFVYFGDGTTGGQNAGISLKAGQHLLGERVGLSIPVNLNGNGSPTVLVTATANRPLIGDATAGAPEGVSAVDVIPAEVAGLSLSGNVNAIEWSTTAAFAGTGTFEIRDNVITGAGAIGVDVNLVGSGATRLSFHDNSLTATGTALNVQELGSGALTITAFDDNVVSGNTGGGGISITTATFDATPGGAFDLVSGGNTVVGASGNGVGTSGIVMTSVAGDILFTDLDVFADGGAGLRVAGTGAANPGGGTGLRFRIGAGVGIVTATGGPAVDLSNLTADLQLTTVTSNGSSTTGVSLDGVSDGGGTNAIFTAGSGSGITLPVGAAGPAFRVNSGNAQVTWAGSITNNSSSARAVSVTSWAGDDATDDILFSGAIDENGAGILLNGNGGVRAINFSGGLDIDTTTGEGFAATSNTNTLGVNVTGSTNDITSTSATALRVTSTTIGSSNLNFRNVSSGNSTAAADPASGIILNATGTTGRLIVTGTGASGQGGNGTGGLIQNTTSHGISLTNTTNPSFTNMSIQSTGGSGINGTQVAGFTFDEGTVSGSGDAVGESNIAFNGSGTLLGNNLSGVVTITDSVLNTAFDSGIHIQSDAGTISNVTLSNNSLTSTTSTATSKGCGIKLNGTGNAATVANITQATIANNVITNFPSACGIQVIGGNVSAAGPAGFVGDPTPGTEAISITGNSISGQSAVNRMGSSGIEVSVNGGNPALRSQGNFIISNNNPITNMAGTGILAGNNGYVDGTYVMDGNTINANNTVASQGIGGGNGIVSSSAETPLMNWTITNNTISNTDGNGILAVGRGVTGTLNVGIRGNSVGAPLSGVRPGIRVDAGNAASVDDAVCAEIANNVSGGSGGHAGIGIRKQGTSATTNDFGIEGLVPSPATCGQAEDRVSSQNPGAVATGADCDGNPGSKTLAISGSNFVSCNSAP